MATNKSYERKKERLSRITANRTPVRLRHAPPSLTGKDVVRMYKSA